MDVNKVVEGYSPRKMTLAEVNEHFNGLTIEQKVLVLNKALVNAVAEIDELKKNNRALRVQVQCLVADSAITAKKLLRMPPPPGIY